MARTIFNFTRQSDSELDTLGENIITMLTDNENFPTPNPDLETVRTHLLEYREALADAALGDRRMGEIKNEKRAQLERTLRTLAMHVEQVAQGNIPLILSAGFDVSRVPATLAGPRPKPEDLNVMPGAHGSGTVDLRVKRDQRARLYRFEHRPMGTPQWTVVQSSRSRVKLRGLQALQQYEFRVAYLGTDPEVTYSDVVTGYVG